MQVRPYSSEWGLLLSGYFAAISTVLLLFGSANALVRA
jgi:hypothetical protein